MTRSPLARRVYSIARRVPAGKVATYGQIAHLAGYAGAARAVGNALANLPARLQAIVPWHRVVTNRGISRHRSPDGSWRQRDLLRSEGVEVGRSGSIDLQRYGWDGPKSPSPKRTRRATPSS